jgi:hypothetical protein
MVLSTLTTATLAARVQLGRLAGLAFFQAHDQKAQAKHGAGDDKYHNQFQW